MGKKYFSPSNFGFYIEDFKDTYKKFNNWPLDLVELTEQDFQEYSINSVPIGKQLSFSNGHLAWVNRLIPEILPHEAVQMELTWVESAINEAREGLEKVQDSDPEAVGTVADWRAYRKALRAWSEHENFPVKRYRPVPPVASKEK